MANGTSRRQFLKYGSSALLGFSSFNLFSLGLSQRASGVAIASVEKRIPQLMYNSGIVGASIAIVREGEIIWNRGFGVKDADTREPVTESTVFAAASLSKPLFAYAAMELCDRGLLNLDTPLTEYTAKPYISDPRIQLITARMVLSHTCGFPNWSGDDPVWIEFTPGTRFSYSSEGFLYLQTVIERLTGEPLNDYMSRNVFAPLGMTSSSYVWRQPYEYSAAKGHDRDGNPYPTSKPKTAMSAGSLRATASDYAKFLIATISSGTNQNFPLPQQRLDEMVRPQVKISQSLSWGLGWGMESTGSGDFFWHWGDSGVFKSFTLGSRKLKTGIVILTNSENGLQMCEEIVNLSIGGQHPAFSFAMIDY